MKFLPTNMTKSIAEPINISVGSEPTFWQAELSQAKLFYKVNWAELFSQKAGQAELFAFKTKPNRAFCFPKLSNLWLFSVDFFKEYNFLVEKTHFYWCLQDYTLKIVKNVKKQLIFCFSR